MDLGLLTSTFAVVFLAEMGDKTQLATLALAGGGSSRWMVFFGASLALIATTAIAVLGGAFVHRYISPLWLKRIAGASFIVLGMMFLLARPEPVAGPAADPAEAAPNKAEVEQQDR